MTRQLVSIRGYVIPDASMIITRSLWITLWTQPATWDEFKALQHGIRRMATWAKRLARGSYEGVARVELVGAIGVACCSVSAPGREQAGTEQQGQVFPHGIPHPKFKVGDVITNHENYVEEIVARDDVIDSMQGKGWHLRILYLPAIAATEATVYDLSEYRLATDDDHARAKSYAATRYDTGEDEDQKASSAGSQPASPSGSRTTRGARSQPGKRSSSQSSAAATRDTQSGSDLAQRSHDSPSHSTSIVPSALSSTSTTAASESRKPRPKKRRMPRDHVS